MSTLLISSLLAIFSLSVSADWQPPLSADEQVTATSLALDSIAARSIADTGNKSSTVTQTHSKTRSTSGLPQNLPQLQNEVLLVELKHAKKNRNQRIAEVFVFDYSRGVTELHRVNVEDNQVTEIIAIDSTHLPLNKREQEVATALAVSNDLVRQRLDAEYQRAFGRALTSLDELDMKVLIWQPQPHQSNSYEIAATCNSERCALLSIFTEDNYSFSLEPVVNLMQGVVYPEALQ